MIQAFEAYNFLSCLLFCGTPERSWHDCMHAYEDTTESSEVQRMKGVRQAKVASGRNEFAECGRVVGPVAVHPVAVVSQVSVGMSHAAPERKRMPHSRCCVFCPSISMIQNIRGRRVFMSDGLKQGERDMATTTEVRNLGSDLASGQVLLRLIMAVVCTSESKAHPSLRSS